MATHIGIGFSQNPESAQAGNDAALQARAQTWNKSIDLVIFFHSIDYNPQKVLSGIVSSIHPSKIIGCSSAGIILSDRIETRGVAVMAIQSDEIRFGVGGIDDISGLQPRASGGSLAKSVIADLGANPRLALLFLLNGLLNNFSSLITGFKETAGTIFPIAGAGASDDLKFEKTYQIAQNKIMTTGGSGLIIGGQGQVAISCKHGWKPLGKPRTIDNCTGNIIYTIDKLKAFYLYEQYLGEKAHTFKEKLPNSLSLLYPLGIFLPEEKQYLLRNAVDILSDGSIVCQGEIPRGSEVHIMLCHKDSCCQAAMDAAIEVKSALKNQTPKFILIFESFARKKLLGLSAFKEIQIIKNVLGSKTPILGMYSYGEISPASTEGNVIKTLFQNESIMIMAVT